MFNSVSFQYGISGLLFIAALFVFLLLIYEYVSIGRLKKCMPDAVIFVLLILFISYVSGSTLSSNYRYKIVPIPAVIFVSVFFIIYSIINFFTEQRKNRDRLTPNSVKEAFDNLDSGICFADENSRIILMNYAMSSLISSILKRYPQTLDDVYEALDSVEKLSENFYKLNNKTVWQLSKSNLTAFTQLSLQDVTELFEANRQLEEENKRLIKTNEEIQKMLERLADRIREQETLSLKMQIHNDIGASLIKISNLINKSNSEDIDKQLALLEGAVSYFSNNKLSGKKDFDETQIKAEGMGVELVINGAFPDFEGSREIVFRAIDECLTNCVIHAKGNRVFVDISENDNQYTVIITNNGIPPEAEIIEGGGLSSLRKKLEAQGNEMEIISDGQFALILRINKGGAK